MKNKRLKIVTCRLAGLPGSRVNCGPYWPGSRVNSGLIGPAAGWIAFAYPIIIGYSIVFCKIQYFTKHYRMSFLLYIRISDFQSHLDRRTTETETHAHLLPVWSVFAVRIQKPWILSYPLIAHQRFWSDWVDAQLIWVFAGCTGNFVGLATVWLTHIQ